MNSSQQKLSYSAQLKAVIILSIGFMLMFTSYTAAQSIITKFYQSNGHQYYGRISLITIYTTFALATAYSAIIVPKLGYKNVFIIGTLCYAVLDSSALIIYFTESEVISVITIVLTSTLCGLAAGNIWVAQNAYIVEISSKDNVNEMFGISQGIRSISSIISFLMTIYVFKYYNGYTFFTILIPISLLSVSLMFFVPATSKESHYKKLDPEQKVGLQKIVSYFKMLAIRQNFDIYIYESLVSFSQALITSFVFKIVDSSFAAEADESVQQYNDRLTSLFGVVLLFFGIGRTVAGFFTKKVTDHIDCFQFCYYTAASCILSIVIGAISYYFLSLWVCCLFSFVLGTAYTNAKTSSNILIKQVFSNDLDFIGINYLLASFSFVFNVILITFLTKISINLCFFVYFLMFIYITKQTGRIGQIQRRKKNQQNSIEMQNV